MKITKNLLIIVAAIFFLMIASNTATALDDADNDVLHWTGINWTDWEWNVSNREDVDIDSIDYTLTGTELILTMTVDGSIKSTNAMYSVWYNSTEAWYHAIVTEGEGVGISYPIDISKYTIEELSQFNFEGVVTISGSTITATFPLVGDENSIDEIHGHAQEWEQEGDILSNFWIDYAPNDFSPYGDYIDYYPEGEDPEDEDPEDEDPEEEDPEEEDPEEEGTTEEVDDDDSDNGSPGFETFLLIGALAIVFIIIKRRK